MESQGTITIRAKSPKGFCRCGIRHPATPVVHPLSRFTLHQLARLKSEPRLEVTVNSGISEEPKAEEPKAEEPKAEEPKAEEPKAEENKPRKSRKKAKG